MLSAALTSLRLPALAHAPWIAWVKLVTSDPSVRNARSMTRHRIGDRHPRQFANAIAWLTPSITKQKQPTATKVGLPVRRQSHQQGGTDDGEQSSSKYNINGLVRYTTHRPRTFGTQINDPTLRRATGARHPQWIPASPPRSTRYRIESFAACLYPYDRRGAATNKHTYSSFL
jgi:hypothetical protein